MGLNTNTNTNTNTIVNSRVSSKSNTNLNLNSSQAQSQVHNRSSNPSSSQNLSLNQSSKFIYSFNITELPKYILMICGFFLMAVGVVFILHADLGMPPWDVFHFGLYPYLPLTYGQIIQGVGLVAVLAGFLMGIKPQLGTLLNMFFIGFFVDLINGLGIIPQPGEIWWRSTQLLVGIFIFSYGTMTYILVGRGTGPRDSLMMAFSRLSGYSLGAVRTVMEVLVTLIGFLLGGPLGVGTVVVAVLVGPCMELCIKLIRWHNGLLMKKCSGAITSKNSDSKNKEASRG